MTAGKTIIAIRHHQKSGKSVRISHLIRVRFLARDIQTMEEKFAELAIRRAAIVVSIIFSISYPVKGLSFKVEFLSQLILVYIYVAGCVDTYHDCKKWKAVFGCTFPYLRIGCRKYCNLCNGKI